MAETTTPVTRAAAVDTSRSFQRHRLVAHVDVALEPPVHRHHVAHPVHLGIPGLLANRTRQQKLTECRRLLHAPPPTDHDGPATALTGPVCPTTRLQALLER